MIWKLEFNELTIKQLSKLDRQIQIRILSFLNNRLLPSNNPRLFGKALTGKLSNYWGYRVGDYRIITEIKDQQLVIVAVSIDHRRQVYDD